MAKKETIVVFGAHPDDFVIGAGGTIKNYLKEKKNIISVVFSLGEKSHIWLKDKVIKDMRKKETLDANKIIGDKRNKVMFLDLGDQNIYSDYQKEKWEHKLLTLLNQKKPTKLFTHSNEDPHPDHKAVHKITLELYDKMETNPELYIYSVWNPVSFKTEHPAFYVDISKTFSVKLKALGAFKSQKFHILYPFFLLLVKTIWDGFKIRKRFAEKFFRIK